MLSERSFRALMILVFVFFATVVSATPILAVDNHSGGHSHAIGEIGDPAKASRTIEIVMVDNAFEPESISVRRGEMVRFVIVNKGGLVHEFNIGTMTMHADHQKEMMVMAEMGILETDRINHQKMKGGTAHGQAMTHNDPNSVSLEPGTSAELTWTFSGDVVLQMVCNVPGHYEAGMFGEIRIN